MGLLSLFIASLLGSPHCAAMCGGLVAFYSQDKRTSVWSHLFYNLGRLCSYLTLGALAGALGAGINSAGDTIGIGHTAAILLGSLLVVLGVTRLLELKAPLLSRVPELFHRYLASIHRRCMGKRSALVAPAVIGAISALMPCGFLYSFVAVAAATGAPLEGIMVLFVFWLGTVPIMATIGKFSQSIIARFGASLPTVTASLLIAAGIFCIIGHVGLGHQSEHCHHHEHR